MLSFRNWFPLHVTNIIYFLSTEPLSGHLITDIFDKAYATIHLGFLGMDLHLFKAELCFKGSIKYDLNILAVSI